MFIKPILPELIVLAAAVANIPPQSGKDCFDRLYFGRRRRFIAERAEADLSRRPAGFGCVFRDNQIDAAGFRGVFR